MQTDLQFGSSPSLREVELKISFTKREKVYESTPTHTTIIMGVELYRIIWPSKKKKIHLAQVIRGKPSAAKVFTRM